MKPLIYVVDDEIEVNKLISQQLSLYDFEVKSFHSGIELEQALKRQVPQLCLLDLGLPDTDGMNLVKKLSQDKDMGLVIISGRDGLADKVLGLEFGADDYISKPFDPRELVARVKSVIRRILPSQDEQPAAQLSKASFAHWCYDPATLTLNNTQQSLALSTAEAEILALFLAKPQQILARERFIKEHSDPFDRSIDVRISRLRKKIEVDHKQPKIIKTVYGSGYIFTAGVSWQ